MNDSSENSIGEGGFDVIPAVDVQDGEVVQLVQGERGTEKSYGEPVEAARRWIDAGASSLHLVDLDGAFEGERENAEAIDSVVEEVDVPTQLGGGIRTVSDAVDLLERGVDRVILGRRRSKNPKSSRRSARSTPVVSSSVSTRKTARSSSRDGPKGGNLAR